VALTTHPHPVSWLKKEYGYNCTPPLRLRGLLLGEPYLLYVSCPKIPSSGKLYKYRRYGTAVYVYGVCSVANHIPYTWTHIIPQCLYFYNYEGWNFNSGNYLFTTDTK